MRPIRKWQVDEDEKTKRDSDIIVGINKISEGNANSNSIFV